MERQAGLEPAHPAWKAGTLPTELLAHLVGPLGLEPRTAPL